MKNSVPISGAVVLDLAWQAGRLVVLSEEANMLRRFGQIDLIKISVNTPLSTTRQGGADEIWCLLEGEADLQLIDRREESPTGNQKAAVRLDVVNPKAVLIPFGVAAEITAKTSGLLMRVTTHSDSLFPEDTIFRYGSAADAV